MKIAIGNDHVGYELKLHIKKYLEQKGFDVVDYGADSPESTDYPIYGEKVGRAVASGDCDLGVLICGTGIGISLAANKVHGIRAAVCSEPYSAQMARRHNNANIIAFGARVVGTDMAEMIVDHFLNAEFEGGRHARRVDRLMAIEEAK
jgi:ribose 5-phosphate isomerase B